MGEQETENVKIKCTHAIATTLVGETKNIPIQTRKTDSEICGQNYLVYHF